MKSSQIFKRTLLSFGLVSALLTPTLADDFLVPLDDRPANRLFVEQIARIGRPQEPLRVVPRHLLGRLLKPGDCDAIAEWVSRETNCGDSIVLSADMWVYGGLVASRAAATDEATVEKRLESLRQLGRDGVRVTVLATIPRLSLRTSDAQAAHERALANWSAKADLPTVEEMLANPDSAPFPDKVPREIVLEYLQVRARNIAMLHQLIEMANKNEIDALVLGQDDANKTGLHVPEQAGLREAISSGGASNRITLISGIDELSMNIIAGEWAKRAGKRPTVRVIYSDPEAAQKIPPMESLPLEEMVDEHLILSGAKKLEGPQADVDLFIYVPYEKPYALPGEEKRPGSEAFVETVRQAMASGRRVAVADLSLINRMDPFLAESVLEDIRLPDLQGFASWNTPANAVGTVIAQVVCHRIAETSPSWKLNERLESEKTHQAFLLARMIDDYGYQTLVRDAVKGQTEGLSATSDPLLNEFGPVGLDIRRRLVDWAQQTFRSHYLGQTLCLQPQNRIVRFRDSKLEVVLPWPRVFEVEARLDLRLEDSGESCSKPEKKKPSGQPRPR